MENDIWKSGHTGSVDLYPWLWLRSGMKLGADLRCQTNSFTHLGCFKSILTVLDVRIAIYFCFQSFLKMSQFSAVAWPCFLKK